MNKADKISFHFRTIDSDLSTINHRLSSTLLSLSDYIKAVPHFNSLIVTEFDERKKTIFIRYFDVEIEITSKLKIFGFEGSDNYCDQITFSIVKSRREENEELLKLYITYDGFIVTDPTQPGSVCETTNSYRGKMILDLLLTALTDKKIINI